MAVESGEKPKVYANYVVVDAVPTQGGMLCTSGGWRAVVGGGGGTTPFGGFFMDGIFRAGS
jgi:hypothetical protein